jgi:sugar phosphate isomerase/epimerase
MSPPLGFINRPWGRFTLERALEGVAASGAKHVAFTGQGDIVVLGWGAPKEHVDAVRTGLERHGLHLVMARLGPYAREEQRTMNTAPVEQVVARAREQIDAVKALGGRLLWTASGPTEQAAWERQLRLMAGVADYAHAVGMTLVMKPHGGIGGTAEGMAAAVREVHSPGFGICYDPGNILYYEGIRPEKDLPGIAEHVVALCVKDETGGKGGNVMVTPGDGEVDFAAVFRLLKSAGFDGPCVIETVSGTTPEEIDAQAKRGLAYLERKVREAGW